MPPRLCYHARRKGVSGVMMATFGLGKIVLYAGDPEAVSAFYARAAGLSFDRVEGTRRYESMSTGGTSLVVDLALEPLPRGRRECALSLRVPNLQAVASSLREDGIDVGPILERPSGVFASLKDPDGRDVELWEPRAKPVSVAPPPLVDKPTLATQEPARIAPPPLPPPPVPLPSDLSALVETPAPGETPAIVDKPAIVAPPALVEVPPVRLEMHSALDLEKEAAAATESATKAEGEDAATEKKRGTEPPPPPPMMGAPGPVVTAARPAKVSTQGGTKISLYGANFADGCRVLVDGDDCTNPKRLDDFTLEIEAPQHAPGSVEVVIENPDGQRSVIQIVYDEGPSIERFSPLEGSPRGDTEVVVEGRNFEEGCRVTFFGNRAPEVIFESPSRIRFVTPPQEQLFHGELRVTNPDGLSALAAELFTYRLATPYVREVSPASGLVGGSKRVAVTGVDFHPQCVARLGGKQATVTFRSAESLELVTPRANEPGLVDLEIENPDGQVTKLEGAFTYEAEPTPPLLVEVRPDRGYCAGGQTIRLVGDNFEADTVVRIGEVRAISRTRSRHEIEVELPQRTQPGLVAIELVDRFGVVVRREDVFTYESRPAPRVDGVTPRNGPMVGGTKIVLEGDYFDEHVFVRIGGQAPKRAVVRSTTTIEAVTPPSRASGFVDIEVGRGDAGNTVVKNAFRYDPSPAPAIDSVAPNKGSVEGGTEVSIEGKNFVAESAVLFGGKPAQRVKFVSASTLEVKTPPGKNGEMVDVVVRNPDGKEAVTKRAFLYDARYRS
ncbi:IPT/TIG domain-containing protein [Polyangium mundeleinium]|uniref:IPT/TIG domain-containing protein n=1 Tax=Polyangium mundeleinium TaxID=2995306 RepID=A0ABT5EGP4_9BACT|nr:IPT/TIG domain-containing protein [Polyangium mundeleinium]MDC0739931.1 IPT/TIG domain-containing protein [Polyangium mundeleinium]